MEFIFLKSILIFFHIKTRKPKRQEKKRKNTGNPIAKSDTGLVPAVETPTFSLSWLIYVLAHSPCLSFSAGL